MTDWRLLFGVLGGPVAWSLHLLASYAVVGLGCMLRWRSAAIGLFALTIACAVAASAAGLVAWRDRRRATPATSRHLLGTIGVILAAVFLGVIVLGGVAPVMVPLC